MPTTSISPPPMTTFVHDTSIIIVFKVVQIDFIKQRISKECRIGAPKIALTNLLFDVPFSIRIIGIMLPRGVIVRRAGMMPRGVRSVLGALSALS